MNCLSAIVSDPGRAEYSGQGGGPQTVSKNNSRHGKMSSLLLPVLPWSGGSWTPAARILFFLNLFLPKGRVEARTEREGRI